MAASVPSSAAAAAHYAFASACTLPTAAGDFEMRVYRDARSGTDAVAMVARVGHGAGAAAAGATAGAAAGAAAAGAAPALHAAVPPGAVLLRVQDQCMTSEIFGSVRCDCKAQLDSALALLQAEARRRHSAALEALPPQPLRAGRRRKREEALAASGSGGASGSASSSGGAAASAAAAAPPGGSEGGEHESDDDGEAAPGESDAERERERVVGLVVYLMQEGRGVGLAAKVAAYALQARGALPSAAGAAGAGVDTVDANRALGLPDDVREYGAVADILRDLGLAGGGPLDSSGGGSGASAPAQLHLLTNNPRKIDKLRESGVVVAGRLSCLVQPAGPLAAAYLRAKAERMGHDIPSSYFE
jgi:GTP cyclohydrolase II